MDAVVQQTHSFLSRKLFSLPKLALLPGVMKKHPSTLLAVLPFIVSMDFVKAGAETYLTTAIEELAKAASETASLRSKVEEFDLKNADALRRNGPAAQAFTRVKWAELTGRYQTLWLQSASLQGFRNFIHWLYWSDILIPTIECALARLIVHAEILPSEVWVYSRGIEDTVDTILMRSRSAAQLAHMRTEMEKLEDLVQLGDTSSAYEKGHTLPCSTNNTSGSDLTIDMLEYSRGTVRVQADGLRLRGGRMYAITGSNGCGKSSLFKILQACDSNASPIALHPSIVMGVEGAFTGGGGGGPTIVMPSSDVVEVAQNLYWPRNVAPIEWMYRQSLAAMRKDEPSLRARVLAAAELLHSLDFYATTSAHDGHASGRTLSGTDDADVDVDDGESCAADPARDHVDDNDGESCAADLAPEIGIAEDAGELGSSGGGVYFANGTLAHTLVTVKDDWYFDELSGGQRSKVELAVKVFLRDECPRVLLVDETLAPLDPVSKSIVMHKLKTFCTQSVILVIYHADGGQVQTDNTNGTTFLEDGVRPSRPSLCSPVGTEASPTSLFDGVVAFSDGVVALQDCGLS
jgi:energy-coupling factor transporter ATP-binding protein EcfA2